MVSGGKPLSGKDQEGPAFFHLDGHFPRRSFIAHSERVIPLDHSILKRILSSLNGNSPQLLINGQNGKIPLTGWHLHRAAFQKLHQVIPVCNQPMYPFFLQGLQQMKVTEQMIQSPAGFPGGLQTVEKLI